MTALSDFMGILKVAISVEKQTQTLRLNSFEPSQEEIKAVCEALRLPESLARFLLQVFFIAYGPNSSNLFGAVYKAKYVIDKCSERNFRARVLDACRRFGYPASLAG